MGSSVVRKGTAEREAGLEGSVGKGRPVLWPENTVPPLLSSNTALFQVLLPGSGPCSTNPPSSLPHPPYQCGESGWGMRRKDHSAGHLWPELGCPGGWEPPSPGFPLPTVFNPRVLGMCVARHQET